MNSHTITYTPCFPCSLLSTTLMFSASYNIMILLKTRLNTKLLMMCEKVLFVKWLATVEAMTFQLFTCISIQVRSQFTNTKPLMICEITLFSKSPATFKTRQVHFFRDLVTRQVTVQPSNIIIASSAKLTVVVMLSPMSQFVDFVVGTVMECFMAEWTMESSSSICNLEY